MKQHSIIISNQRSEHTGDTTQGNIRIAQTIEAHGEQYEVWTYREAEKLVVYQTRDNKKYAYHFDIKNLKDDPITILRQRTVTKQVNGTPELIDNVAYGEPDASGKQAIRNSIVLPQDTMINDEGRMITGDELRETHSKQFAVVAHAIEEQNKFLQDVVRMADIQQHRSGRSPKPHTQSSAAR